MFSMSLREFAKKQANKDVKKDKGKTKTVRQGHLFGTPTADDIGASIIALQCVDSYGLTMKMVFGLTVS